MIMACAGKKIKFYFLWVGGSSIHINWDFFVPVSVNEQGFLYVVHNQLISKIEKGGVVIVYLGLLGKTFKQ
jgi:hypothetical protein